jgi:hypothetical protein
MLSPSLPGTVIPAAGSLPPAPCQAGAGGPSTPRRAEPVTYEAQIVLPEGGQRIALVDALRLLKSAVPFDLFRYASKQSRKPQDRAAAEQDYPGRSVDILPGPVSVLEHIRTVVGQLPGWQATVLPQGVILYKETQDYDYALAGWWRTLTGVEGIRGGQETR